MTSYFNNFDQINKFHIITQPQNLMTWQIQICSGFLRHHLPAPEHVPIPTTIRRIRTSNRPEHSTMHLPPHLLHLFFIHCLLKIRYFCLFEAAMLLPVIKYALAANFQFQGRQG